MRAEYDHKNNRVVNIETDDGRVTPTTNARVLGSETEWIPVTVVYPDGYDQRFYNLLSPQNVEYRFVSGRVEVHYPEADFSTEAIRAELREGVKRSAHAELSRTDWYLVRQVETGESVPEEVRADRQAIRERTDEVEARLDETPDDELSTFSFTLSTSEQGFAPARVPATPAPGTDGREWVTDATSPSEEGKPLRPAEPSEIPGELAPPKVGTGLSWDLSDGTDSKKGE